MKKSDLVYREFVGVGAYFRPGSSDERVLVEVLEKAAYRKRKIGFDVEAGEHWLDLGANIGAFALYCKSKGATAECYEPDPLCFQILKYNAPRSWKLFNAAVTSSSSDVLPFWKGRGEKDYYRNTIFRSKSLPVHPSGMLPNLHGGFLKAMKFDGVKMDIEGSESGLLDNKYIPKCEKLCMEYHLSRDPSAANLARRLRFLKSRFKHVDYPADVEAIAKSGVDGKTFFDRVIYCWGAK